MCENMPALKTEMAQFEQALQNQFRSKRSIHSYLNGLSLDVIQSGGKRLRPAMAIASAMLGEYDRDRVVGAALSIEMLHTATLVHDDIVDNARVRRSAPTVFSREGVNTAVFTGDFLLVKSLLALASADLPVRQMQQLAKAIEAVCVGEVEQYRGRGTLPGYKTYLSRISRKTGRAVCGRLRRGRVSGGAVR